MGSSSLPPRSFVGTAFLADTGAGLGALVDGIAGGGKGAGIGAGARGRWNRHRRLPKGAATADSQRSLA
jgi:hypothetical protein